MKICVLVEDTSSNAELESEHGLSLFIEADGRRILFDTGQTGMFARNAVKLGIDLSLVDLAVISHGHYDHTGGLGTFFDVNDHAPVYVHKRAFEKRRASDGRDIGMDPGLLSSGRIVLTGDDHDLGGNMRLCTCNGKKPLFPSHSGGLLMLRDGEYVQDDFSHEQYLCIREGGKLAVVSGCSHKGALNIVRWLGPDVLIGGFHFMPLDAEGEGGAVLDESAREMAGADTQYFTCHCTGVAQFDHLKRILGERIRYVSCGARFGCLGE